MVLDVKKEVNDFCTWITSVYYKMCTEGDCNFIERCKLVDTITPADCNCLNEQQIEAIFKLINSYVTVTSVDVIKNMTECTVYKQKHKNTDIMTTKKIDNYSLLLSYGSDNTVMLRDLYNNMFAVVPDCNTEETRALIFLRICLAVYAVHTNKTTLLFKRIIRKTGIQPYENEYFEAVLEEIPTGHLFVNTLDSIKFFNAVYNKANVVSTADIEQLQKELVSFVAVLVKVTDILVKDGLYMYVDVRKYLRMLLLQQ